MRSPARKSWTVRCAPSISRRVSSRPVRSGRRETRGQGRHGGQGRQGREGDPGTPGLSGYEIVRVVKTVTNANFNDITVTCPAGKKALGWGYTCGAYSPGDGPFPQHATPTVNGTGWSITAARYPAATWTGVGYAICATVAP